MKRKGFGVEDSPFMILATVLVMMLVVWIGIEVMGSFVEGNERQAAISAAAEIYKRARLVSLGYEGSTEKVSVSVPEGYAIRIDNYIVPLGGPEFINDSLNGSNELTGRMIVEGVGIDSSEGIMYSGEHEVKLVYSSKNAKVVVSW